MNIPRWFRHSRPTPAPPRLTTHDQTIASWYELTPDEWAALPNHLRADYRDLYMKVKMP